MSFIASPAGEKAVRDKVRELAKGFIIALYSEKVDIYEVKSLGVDMGTLAPTASLRKPGPTELSFEVDGHIGHGITEAEAYAAALLWLAERSEK